nr:phosphatase PAP2 family protein [Thermoanaerobacterales bacterium]
MSETHPSPTPPAGAREPEERPEDAPAARRRGMAGTTALALAGAGVVALAVSWLLLGDPVQVVPGWEESLFRTVNGWPDRLRWPLWPVMQAGTTTVGLACAVAVLVVGRRWQPAAATASAVALAWVGAWLVKETAGRGRPVELLHGVELREGWRESNGFVSGHTAVGFALATTLVAVLPGRWRLLPYPLAALVGVARVHVGVHLPLDVVGGAGLGTACGAVALAVFGVAGPWPGRRADAGAGPEAAA